MLNNLLDFEIKKKHFKIFNYISILTFAIIPLFTTFNYRINIYLSWEGAYRMYLGQIPYEDFGLPLGFGYWIIPSLFFKIFGPQFISLIKAQVFLNILSGFSFWQILKNFNVNAGVISIAIFAFCISFTFINAWPWYNHTVIVYQLVGLALITATFTLSIGKIRSLVLLFSGAFFLLLSFFTKQDAGFLGLLIAFILIVVYSFHTKKWINLMVFCASLIVISLITIFSLNPSFSYWFNYGQAPHNSRLSILDILDEFFNASLWIKFYIVAIGFIVLHAFHKRIKVPFPEILFILFTLGILAEAAIFQVTSYVPEDNNIFFHSFSIAFILNYLIKNNAININRIPFFSSILIFVCFFWSANYWKYAQRLTSSFRQETSDISVTGENVVNKNNYIKDNFRTGTVPTFLWEKSDLYTLKNIKMPVSTIQGIERLRNMPEMENPSTKKILNMSELTFLAHDIGFELETGAYYPLWYHLGVGMFNKQLAMFIEKIRSKEYDVVIYEYMPHLNNFYPLALRDTLKKEYELKDTFLAPRDPTNCNIEIYVKKK
jgi:hypothetical protein